MKTFKIISNYFKKFLGNHSFNGEAINLPQDFSDQKLRIFQRVKPFTMTSPERIACLIDSIEYISTNSIPGAIVECGVWRGGSTMAAAIALVEIGDINRDIYLYDTFEGMPAPGKEDVRHDGIGAKKLLCNGEKSLDDLHSAYAPIAQVKNNVFSTGYPEDRIQFIPGKVEETIPNTIPNEIAILRLDTDWYSSTIHELQHLYPRLSPGGILIIDDYGYWKGARQAVDEYFSSLNPKPFLSRIDDTGRSSVKPF
jgi:hypothetical protein